MAVEIRQEELSEKLLSSAAMGEIAALRDALSSGADPSAKDQWGWTALMLACNWGNQQAALELLSAGANLGDQNPEGQSAADLALDSGHCELWEMLKSLMEKALLENIGGGASGDTRRGGL